MQSSEQINELATALSELHGEINDPAKDGKGRFGAYVPLDTVLSALRAALPARGLSFVQGVGGDSGITTVTTRVMHTSGQWIEETVGAAPEGNKGTTTIQAMGGTVTYLRRYSLMAMFGLTGDDDNDGDPAPAPQRKPAARPQARPVVQNGKPPVPDEDWPHYGDGTPVSEKALDFYAAFVAVNGDAPKAAQHLRNWYTKHKDELEQGTLIPNGPNPYEVD